MVFETCGFSNSTLDMYLGIKYATYEILLRYWLTVGLLLNLILVTALYKLAKTERGYTYQLVLFIDKIAENLIWGLYLAFLNYGYNTQNWLVQNYLFVILYARVFVPLQVFCLCNCLPISVAVVADRVFALWKPFIYKNIDHRRHQIVCIVCSTILAALITFGDTMTKKITLQNDNVTYTIAANYEFLNSAIGLAYAGYIRMVARLGCVLAIIILNFSAITMYKRRLIKLSAMTNSQEKTQARQEMNKELVILSVCQSCSAVLSQTIHSTLDVVRRSSNYLWDCAVIMSPVADCCIILANTLEFFVVVFVNKKIRTHVARILLLDRFCSELNNQSVVVPIPINSPNIN